MANRFNQIFTQQEYVPLVQDLPYDALAGFAADAEKKAEEDLKASLSLKELFKNTKVAKVDYPYWEQVDKEYSPLLSDVADSAIKGGKDARKKIFEVQAKMASDPRFKMFEANYATEKAAEDSAIKLREQGKFSQLGWSDTFNNAAASRKEFGLIPWQGHDPWSDYTVDAQRLIGGINDTHLWSTLPQLGVDPKTNALILWKGRKATGITDKRIEQEAFSLLDAFKNTPGGLSRIKDYIHSGQAATEEELNALLFEDLKNIGSKQRGINMDAQDWSFAPEHLSKKGVQPTYGFGQSKEIGKSVEGIAKDNLNLSSSGTKVIKRTTPSGQGIDFTTERTDIQERENYKPKNFVESRALELANAYSGRPVSSGPEAIDNINNYIKDFSKSIEYPIYSLDQDAKDIRDVNFVLFDPESRQIKNMDQVIPITAEGNKMTGAEFYEKYGEDPKKVGVSKRLQLINPYGIPYAPVIETDDGEYLINNPLSSSVTSQERAIAEWGKAAYSPIPVSVELTIVENDRPVKKTYYVEFERESELGDKGQMLFSNSGIARLYRSDGSVVAESSLTDFSFAIPELYQKVLKGE